MCPDNLNKSKKHRFRGVLMIDQKNNAILDLFKFTKAFLCYFCRSFIYLNQMGIPKKDKSAFIPEIPRNAIKKK